MPAVSAMSRGCSTNAIVSPTSNLSRNCETEGIESAVLGGRRLAENQAANGIRHSRREEDSIAELATGNKEAIHRGRPQHGRVIRRARPQVPPTSPPTATPQAME